MDVVLEELMDEGAAVLGDGRPSEYTFKIHGEKTNVTIVIIIAPLWSLHTWSFEGIFKM